MNTLILPRQYHEPGTFAAEQERIFAKTWACVGFLHELKRHNDLIARNVGGQSVVVHNFNGALRAFLNMCSHRFNRIHTARQGNRPLQCGYLPRSLKTKFLSINICWNSASISIISLFRGA